MASLTPVLTPPFLSDIRPAADPDFPVRVTRRAARKLFWHIVHTDQRTGGGVQLTTNGPGGWPRAEWCDVSSLDPTTHRVTKFGRVPVGMAVELVDVLAGWVLDCTSFPPGPISFDLADARPGASSGASHPGRYTLSLDKLRAVQPDLFRRANWFTKAASAVLHVTMPLGSAGKTNSARIGRWVGADDPDGQCQAIESLAAMLWDYDTNPAVVVSIAPFVVAAYAWDIDGVTLLRLPNKLAAGRAAGDRMISCNSYWHSDDPSGDTPPGPKASGVWNDCTCVLADLLTDDADRLAARKADIAEAAWERCRALGAARLAAGHRFRDGRPWLSRVAVRDQGRGDWRRRGGFLR